MSTARSVFFYLLGAFGVFIGYVLLTFDGYVEDSGSEPTETTAYWIFYLVTSVALLVFARRGRRSSDGKRETAIAWGLSVVLTVGLAIGAYRFYGPDPPSDYEATTFASSYGRGHCELPHKNPLILKPG
jgi:membrane protease YdiL (CAAX protease family)